MGRFDVSVWSWQGTVLAKIYPMVLAYMVYAGAYVYVYLHYWWDGKTTGAQMHMIPILSVVLGCLLGVRTNTAYERYSEGCRCWSSVILASRSLMRHLVHGRARGPGASSLPDPEVVRSSQHRAANLLIAFVMSLVMHLREEFDDEPSPPSEARTQLLALLPAHLRWEADAYPTHQENLPLSILNHMHDYLVHIQRDLAVIDQDQMKSLVPLLGTLSDALGAMERVKRTPLPHAYSVHLRQILTIYCLALPPQLVGALHWWLVPVMGAAVFTFLGVEAIGSEIENPFEKDFNDLPSDEYCAKISEEIARVLGVQQVRPKGDGSLWPGAVQEPQQWVWSTDRFLDGRDHVDPPEQEETEAVHKRMRGGTMAASDMD